MLKFGNKEFRNLEEQVDKNKQDIADLTAGISAAIGYMPTILGVYATFAEIPTGGYNTGDTFLIGNGTPYSVYVYTDKNKWVNVGQFPVAGPKGDKGDLGSVITAAAGGPQVTPESLNDFYIDTITGDWYEASRTDSGSLVYIKSFSLKGEKGDRGERGLAGSMGPQGPTGAQGPQGERGFTGLKGDQGQKGDTGATGPAGNSVTNMSTASFTQDTIDPTIMHNSIDVSYSDGTSATFVVDTKGIKGDAGPQGPAGTDGINGKDGATGPTGPTGPIGPTGPQGEQGIQGVKGETGAVGPTGPQGIQGPQGPTGNGVEDLISVKDIGAPVVTYDTQDGITISSTDQYTYGTDNKTFDVSTEREIPIIAGDGISIDKAVDSEKIVIKNSKPYTVYKIKYQDFKSKNLSDELKQALINDPESIGIQIYDYSDASIENEALKNNIINYVSVYNKSLIGTEDVLNNMQFRGCIGIQAGGNLLSYYFSWMWLQPNSATYYYQIIDARAQANANASNELTSLKIGIVTYKLPTIEANPTTDSTEALSKLTLRNTTYSVFSPTDTQTAAIDSGITADKVTTYDNYPTSIADAKKAGTDAQTNLTAYQTSNDAALKDVKTTADNALPLSGGTLTGVLNGVRINTTGTITSGTTIKAGSTHTYTQINDTGILVQKDTSNRSIITGSATEFIRSQANGVITNYNLPYTDGETYTFATTSGLDGKVSKTGTSAITGILDFAHGADSHINKKISQFVPNNSATILTLEDQQSNKTYNILSAGIAIDSVTQTIGNKSLYLGADEEYDLKFIGKSKAPQYKKWNETKYKSLALESEIVTIDSPSTATSGTLIASQLDILKASDNNYISFNNEEYYLFDKGHTEGYLTYSHVGIENGIHYIKTITITISTAAWTLITSDTNKTKYKHRVTILHQEEAGGKNYNGYIEVFNDNDTPLTIDTIPDGSYPFTQVGTTGLSGLYNFTVTTADATKSFTCSHYRPMSTGSAFALQPTSYTAQLSDNTTSVQEDIITEF